MTRGAAHRLQWPVAAAAVAVTLGLTLLAVCVRSEVTRVAVPGILTGVGTLALAGLTYLLLRRDDDNQRNTQEALEHSRQLVVEASLQRRDRRARGVLITAEDSPMILRESFGGAPPILLSSGTLVEHLDGYPDSVTVRAIFRITAVDGRPIVVSPSPNLISLPEGGVSHAEGADVIIPTEGWRFRFDTVRSFAEWDAIIEQRMQGQPGDEGRASLVVSDEHDDGVIDHYEFIQGGTPLVRQPYKPDSWSVDLSTDPFPRVAVRAYPHTRRYWISKIRNEEFLP